MSERAAAIREHLALSEGIYSNYSARVARFVSEIGQFEPFCLPIKKPRLAKSRLFGRKFLVANPNEENDDLLGVGLDAVAIECIEFAGFPSPPIVVTAKRQKGRERLYQSILEHEFVHICQMLLGLLPDFDPAPGGPTRFLEARTRAEFQAYFLQHSYWPDLYSSRQIRGMAVDEYCCFAAYVHSLEDTLRCVLGEDGGLAVIEDFLAATPARLHKLVGPLGFPDAICQFYVDMFPGHIETALGVVIDNSQGHFPDQYVNFIKRWLNEASPGARGIK